MRYDNAWARFPSCSAEQNRIDLLNERSMKVGRRGGQPDGLGGDFLSPRVGGASRHRRTNDLLVSFDFPPAIGGAHKWLYELYSRWPTPVRVLTAAYSSDPREATQQTEFDCGIDNSLRISRRVGVMPHFDALSPKYLALLWKQCAAVRELAEVKGNTGFDSVTIHALRAVPDGIPAWLYCKSNSANARLVTFVHGEEVLVSKTSRQLSFLSRKVYEASDLVIANSENTRKLLMEAFPNVNSVCIHPGVDSNAFRIPERDRRRYREKFGWPRECVVVLTLARMEPRKNHSMVIRAIAELLKEQLPIALVCAGDGPDRADLEKLADSLGISQWVKFPGVVPEPEKPQLFASADIFAMPSISVGEMIEGFGIVFVEAAAAGVPTVCGLTGGQQEAIVHGKSGFAVEGASVDAVAGAIRKLATDVELRRSFGNEGLKLAEAHDWEVLVQKVRDEIAGCWR